MADEIMETAPAPEEEPVAETPVAPTRVRFLRETKWCIGTADGPSEQVFADGDIDEFPQEIALVFVGMGAAVIDDEAAVRHAGEKATRRRK